MQVESCAKITVTKIRHCCIAGHGLESLIIFCRDTVVHRLSAVLKQLLLYGIVTTAVVFCWYNREHLARITELSPLAVSAILAAYLAAYILNAAMAGLLLANRGHTAGLWDMLVMNSAASVLGYATFFRAGFYGGKALFYHRYYGLAVSTSLGLMGLLSLQIIGVNAMFGALLGIQAALASAVEVPAVYWVIVAGSLGLCVFLLVALKGMVRARFIPARIRQWLENVHQVVMATEGRELVLVALMSVASIGIQAVALGFLFSGFGFPLPMVFLLFTAVLSTLSLVIALTPSNVGVKELVIWMLLSGGGGSAGEIVSVMLVDRLLQFLVLMAVSLAGYRGLKKKLQ
jgi:uncharacterized membrane protein YbhN (UPF0104 family)